MSVLSACIFRRVLKKNMEMKYWMHFGGDLKIREQIRRKTEILSDAVFSYVSDTKTPQGVLAVVRQMEYTLEQMTDEVTRI